MTTQNWTKLKNIPPAYHVIKEWGLTEHLEELDAYGLTVIPPEKIGGDRILERMRAAILRIAEEDTGAKYDIETGAHGTQMNQGTNSCSASALCVSGERPGLRGDYPTPDDLTADGILSRGGLPAVLAHLFHQMAGS